MIVQKQMIPHLKTLMMDINILEEIGGGIIRGLPCTLFVKSVLFMKKGRDNRLRRPRPCPPRIFFCSQPELLNEVLWVFVSFVLFE